VKTSIKTPESKLGDPLTKSNIEIKELEIHPAIKIGNASVELNNVRTKGMPGLSTSSNTEMGVDSERIFVENLNLLWKGSHHKGNLKMDVVDSILFTKGVPTTWFFTSLKTGHFMKKYSENITVNKIVSHFEHQLEGRHYAGGFACVARFRSDDQDHLRVEFLDSQQLLSLFQDEILMLHLVSLQSCASLNTACVYSTKYKLGAHGIKHEFETCRLSSDRSVAGSKNIQIQDNIKSSISRENETRNCYIKENEVTIRSKATRTNSKIENLTKDIVQYIEAARPCCQIAALRTEFIVNGEETVLTHVSDVLFRKPIVKRLPSLSNRSDGSESIESLFSSRSFQSIAESPKDSVIDAPLSQGGLKSLARSIASGPRANLCWGGYCNDRQDTELKEIVLLSIIMAAIQGVKVRRAKNLIAFEVKRVDRPYSITCLQIEQSYHIASSRLYSSVNVCSTCFEMYHMIDEQRGSWKLQIPVPEDLSVIDFDEVMREYRLDHLLTKNGNTPSAAERHPVLARAFFLTNQHQEKFVSKKQLVPPPPSHPPPNWNEPISKNATSTMISEEQLDGRCEPDIENRRKKFHQPIDRRKSNVSQLHSKMCPSLNLDGVTPPLLSIHHRNFIPPKI